jgi:propionyl-CoA synthetase
MSSYQNFYQRSIGDPSGFWAEQAGLIDWKVQPTQICDYSSPPFANWFAGGITNLCHNAIDRHLPYQAHAPALIYVSTETGQERVYSFLELHEEVQRMAAVLVGLGVVKGDRVLIYMPMIPEAAFAMLACARIGAIHSVVFGGFASVSLAARIEDATPRVIVSADAGSRVGKIVPYKPLVDEAVELSSHKPQSVLYVDRGLAPMAGWIAGRDSDYATLREQNFDAFVPCEWVDAAHPSYILYTSGTTGKPKGVQRDTGGYAVALAASIKHIFDGRPGETFFSTSDIGWVVGHSYIVYGPLLAGMATLMYEGVPVQPDAGIWWRLVEKYKVNVMFSAPTAVRVLKKHDLKFLQQCDLTSLRTLFLAGEPLDQPTAQWITEALGKPVVDNYWQTETGWPILTLCQGVDDSKGRLGSPGKAVYGYNIKLLDESTGGEILGANEKGVVVIEGPLPPGCLQTLWGDDERFLKTYWSTHDGRLTYNTFDWGVRDQDGFYFILGRTDDVINVAGHRLGTREIEESIASHPDVAEVAVVGIADALKGQVALAVVVPRQSSHLREIAERMRLEGEVMKVVERQLGSIARPSRVILVSMLPKTRSGKTLRRSIQAVCEGRKAGDLTTIEDPASLDELKALVSPEIST